MDDPVSTCDGFTYERSSIERWLRQSSLSPLTNLVLPRKELTPNVALRQLITQFREANRGAEVDYI
jgi:hypothetical protein